MTRVEVLEDPPEPTRRHECPSEGPEVGVVRRKQPRLNSSRATLHRPPRGPMEILLQVRLPLSSNPTIAPAAHL